MNEEKYVTYEKYLDLIKGILVLARSFKKYANNRGDFKMANVMEEAMDDFLDEAKRIDPERFNELVDVAYP